MQKKYNVKKAMKRRLRNKPHDRNTKHQENQTPILIDCENTQSRMQTNFESLTKQGIRSVSDEDFEAFKTSLDDLILSTAPVSDQGKALSETPTT